MSTQIADTDIPEAREDTGIAQALRDYWARVKGGNTGSLPAVLGLIALVVLFTVLQGGVFFTALNFANLLNQGTAIIVLAMGIPYFEILTGIGILSGRARRAGALAACGLSVCFVLLYASALARGIDVKCACFGNWEILQASTRVGFVRALVLLGLSGWVYAKAWLPHLRNRGAECSGERTRLRVP